MPAYRHMTLTRLREILRRQDPPRWGAEYEPAIRATRQEAPSISYAAQLWSQKLRRYVHVLSRVEEKAAILALFHPALFELQEQRMLSLLPRPHPLSGHPLTVGLDLSPLQGTIAVAERLDLIGEHTWIRYREPDTGAETQVPRPFIGDLLLCLVDDRGPYCINWTVKKTVADFERSASARRRMRALGADASRERHRHGIEDVYYQDAGIRTVRIVEDLLPTCLVTNLRCLFLHSRERGVLSPAVERELEDRLRASVGTDESPLQIATAIAHRRGCNFDDLADATYRLLWQRRVSTELVNRPVFFDQPLAVERISVLRHYAHLFAREA